MDPTLVRDALDGARLDAFDDDQIKLLYAAAHESLLKAARKMDMAAMQKWNERADDYAGELRRRFLIVPTVYAVAG